MRSRASAANPGLYVGSAATGPSSGARPDPAGDTPAATARPLGEPCIVGRGRTDGPFTVGAVKGDTRYRVQVSSRSGRRHPPPRRGTVEGCRRDAAPLADRRAGRRRLGAAGRPPPRPLARPRRPAAARPDRERRLPRSPAATSRSASRTTIRARRWAGSAERSTPCSARSRRRSTSAPRPRTACAASSPTRRTSCARRSPPCAPTPSCSTAAPASVRTTSSGR